MVKQKKTSNYGMLFKFYKKYFFKYLPRVIAVIILNIVIAGCGSAIAYLIGPVINKVFLAKQSWLLFSFVMALLVITLIKTISMYIVGVFNTLLSLKASNAIRLEVFKKLISMPMTDLNHLPKGQFMTLVQNDVFNIDYFFTYHLPNLVKEGVLCIALLGVIFYTNWQLALIIILLYPGVIIPLNATMKKIQTKTFIVQTCNQDVTSKLIDTQAGIKTIKAYNGEKREVLFFWKTITKLIKSAYSAVRTSALVSPINEMMTGIIIVMTISIGGYQVSHNIIDLGSFVSFLAALLMVIHPIKSVINCASILSTTMVSMMRVDTFFKTNNKENILDGTKPDLSSPFIEIKNLNFKYQIAEQSLVKDEIKDITLSNINLAIKPKTKVAFVGMSGSGKSTIMSLLMRLYEADSGEIDINGENIQNMSALHLRKNIAYIGQDAFLFDESIERNIVYNTNITSAKKQKLQKVLQMAQAEFVYDLPNGIKTEAGLQGGNLSGGQKQRIAIARGIIKDAPIVIFDEATSALDATTESKIRDMIFTEMQDKTIIIVAHRLSTITDCDCIYCMNEGKIVEQGTHQELLDKDGFYAKLWKNFQNNNAL